QATSGPRGSLSAITAAAPNDLWTAGPKGQLFNLEQAPLFFQHWDGQHWSMRDAPRLPDTLHADFVSLGDIAAVSATDVWAVGSYGYQVAYQPGPLDRSGTLIMHWNGQNWRIVPSPNPGHNYNDLGAIAAVSANDVWAAGFNNDAIGKSQPLLLHWDGATWTVASPPQVGGELHDIAAIAADDIWAVGETPGRQSLTIHWDGRQWTPVPAPNGCPLSGVAASGTNDVWAVGSGTLTPSCEPTPCHWDGQTCRRVPYSYPAEAVDFDDITAFAPNDAWLVGSYQYADMPRAVVAHWDGRAWSTIPAPTFAKFQKFETLTKAAGGEVWMAGFATEDEL